MSFTGISFYNGFQKGSPEAEDILSRGGCRLIIYSVGNL